MRKKDFGPPMRASRPRRLRSTAFKTEQARSKLLLDNAQKEYQYNLIAKQDYDQKKADYESATASVRENEARAGADESRSGRRPRRSLPPRSAAWRRRRPDLARMDDVLAKYDVVAPLDGVVTNLPVRVGETVVPGVQNSAASTIMTIADMSLITAEVKVDETDIVNVQLGQTADGHHRRDPDRLHRARDRDRQHRHPALHRPGGFAERHFQPGSQGFQSGDRAGSIRPTRFARACPAPRRSPRPRARMCWRFRFRR